MTETDKIIEAVKAAITPITRRDLPKHAWLDDDEIDAIARAAIIAHTKALMEKAQDGEWVFAAFKNNIGPTVAEDAVVPMLAALLEEMK